MRIAYKRLDLLRALVLSLLSLAFFSAGCSSDQPSSQYVVTSAIVDGPDDGFSGQWAYSDNTDWYEAGNPGSPYSAWFRFTDIGIPKKARIVNAYLEMVHTGWNPDTRLVIRAEKSGNPLHPTTESDHESRVRTNAGAVWSSGSNNSTWHKSPDFALVIQELVNRFDYSQGASILILIDDYGSAEGAKHSGHTFESGMAPKLYIEFR